MDVLLRDERLIGVLHLSPTPGAPGAVPRVDAGAAVERLVERAVADARAYARGGIRSLIVENFHDAPFVKDSVAPETVAAMALAVRAVREVPGIERLGLNVLRNDARSALGIAAASGAEFIRVNVHTGTMFTDQGLVEGRAAATIRERARLCPQVLVLADVHVKHATPVPGETLEDAARDAASRGHADGLIVSGVATGSAPGPERVAAVRRAVGDGVPLLIGSGFSVSNAASLLAHAHGAIVGTAAKEDGDVAAPVDPERVRSLVAAASDQ